MHRVPQPSPATPGLASSLVCQSCSDIAVEGGEKRDNSQMMEPVSLKFWPLSKQIHKQINRVNFNASTGPSCQREIIHDVP